MYFETFYAHISQILFEMLVHTKVVSKNEQLPGVLLHWGLGGKQKALCWFSALGRASSIESLHYVKQVKDVASEDIPLNKI